MNLDCETPELAEQSLADVLRIDRARIHTHLRKFKLTDFEVNEDMMDDRWRPMLNVVAGRDIADTDSGQTSWFHATRVKDLASFREGIRSLPRQLDETWAALQLDVAREDSRHTSVQNRAR